MNLSHDEISRYSRHLIMPEVGLQGQLKLKQARVLCVGTGGLGSPLALYLAAAGVGTLGLMDADLVDVSNLQRQVLHFTPDVGRPKVLSAQEKIESLNPHVKVIAHQVMLSPDNALEICGQYDIVVDGTDNFTTRYLVNDACVLLGIPNVHASIFRFDGQASVFWARQGPCYRCLYPEPPPQGEIPNCAEGGVLGILPGLFGVIQATEVIKLILGAGAPLIGRLLVMDALDMRTRELRIKKNAHCPACGENPSITSLRQHDYEVLCGLPASADAQMPAISPVEVQARREREPQLVLLDVRDPHEWEVCRIEGAVHIPLAQLEERHGELPADRPVIVYCLVGGRARKAQRILLDAGRPDVVNMAGGLRAWASNVDPTMPIY